MHLSFSVCDGNHFYDELSRICIRIVNNHMSFDEAVTACQDYGEQLVTIDTHEKMVFIEYTLMRNSGMCYSLTNKFVTRLCIHV